MSFFGDLQPGQGVVDAHLHQFVAGTACLGGHILQFGEHWSGKRTETTVDLPTAGLRCGTINLSSCAILHLRQYFLVVIMVHNGV